MTKKQTTVISAHTKVDGKIRGSENLTVFGRASGAIEIDGTVEIASSGIVEADVVATRVIVAGVVVGTITAKEALIVESTGRVVGELKAPTLRVAEGAQYAGRLDVSGAVRVEEQPTPHVHQPAPTPEHQRRPTTKRIVVKKHRKDGTPNHVVMA